MNTYAAREIQAQTSCLQTDEEEPGSLYRSGSAHSGLAVTGGAV